MIKIGMYLPMYGGWYQDAVNEEEKMPSYNYVKQVALEAERIGIHSLWIPDHMLNPLKGERAPSLEAWTLATAIAEATTSVIIVHTTLCEAFRYPAVLAKQATTLNDISGGRFWLSIGAGWFKREFDAYGQPFYDHDERVARVKETIQIIRAVWEQDSVIFKGKFYSIQNCVLEPKPNPKPPIWYAGMSKASRNLVVEVADGWLMDSCTLEEAEQNITEIQNRLERKGKNKIEYAIPALTFVRNTDEEAKKYVEQVTRGSREKLNRSMNTGAVGSPETVAHRIRKLESMGINHFLLQLTPSLRELRNIEKVLDILRLKN